MIKSSSVLLPTIVGISVYIIVSKLFPEKVSDINSQKDLRGGNLVKNHLIKKIIKKIMKDRALKIAIFSLFTTAGLQHFLEEITILLKDDKFNQICSKEVNRPLKIVCDIIQEHELNLHSTSIKKLIIDKNLSQEDKIHLLKIKLDFIINGEFAGKKRFLLMTIIAALITVSISGIGGLALFFEALYRLFQEGKISQALYETILETVTNNSTKVPVENLL